MSQITAWARGPFGLLVHAEELYRNGEEYARRIALINFDNAVEVSIKNYLSLHPIQRNGKQYAAIDVANWGQNFHTLIGFFFNVFLSELVCTRLCEEAELIHYHRVRNEQYHGGTMNLPPIEDLKGAKQAAIWVFSALYHITDCEAQIDARLLTQAARPRVQRSELIDHLLDSNFDPVDAGGLIFSPSEVLYNLEPDGYVELGASLKDAQIVSRPRRKLA